MRNAFDELKRRKAIFSFVLLCVVSVMALVLAFVNAGGNDNSGVSSGTTYASDSTVSTGDPVAPEETVDLNPPPTEDDRFVPDATEGTEGKMTD